MTEWIVKDKGYVPLPPEHVLRKDVDQVCISDSQPAWISVGTSAGESVGASAYPRACCRVEDWPEELGPVPQEPCSEQEFRVEVGKRYIEARSKTVVGPLANTDPSDPDAAEYPFCDPRRRRTYTSSGRILKDHKTPGDLIAEYHEPAAEPAVSTEPQPGQWWVFEGNPQFEVCRYVGRGWSGMYVFECRHFVIKSFVTLECMRHEPRCTGFDWTPPEEQEQPTADDKVVRSATFRQYFPSIVDVDGIPPEFGFASTEELLGIDCVQRHANRENFSHFAMSGCDLMAVSDGGFDWRVVGSVSDTSLVELPEWEGWKFRAEMPDGSRVVLNKEVVASCGDVLTLRDGTKAKRLIGSHDEFAVEPTEPSEPTESQEIIESLTKFAEELERESSKKQERTIAELRAQCERQAATIESLQAHIESDKRWIKSLQEQIAELTPRPPAEDPDEWVTQDRVPMRACDQRRWVNPVSMDVAVEWGRSCITSVDPAIHGAVNRVGNRLELRCRRKDLPPLPDTTPEPPKTRTIPMAVVLVSHDEVQWIEARVSMRDGKPDVPDADAKVRIVEEYTREISVGE